MRLQLAGQHARTILIDQKQPGLQPVFLFQCPGDRLGILPAPDGIDMSSGAQKDALAEGVRAVMRDQGALAYSFVSEAWMAHFDAHEVTPASLTNHPRRIEVVWAVAFDAKGDARSASWRMIRDSRHRVVDLVEEVRMGDEDTLAGRFANLLQARA